MIEQGSGIVDDLNTDPALAVYRVDVVLPRSLSPEEALQQLRGALEEAAGRVTLEAVAAEFGRGYQDYDLRVPGQDGAE